MGRMKEVAATGRKPDHGRMICSPLDWPKYPILPLKRYVPLQTWPDLAVIAANTRCMTAKEPGRETADESKPFSILFEANLFEEGLADRLKTAPMKTYENLAALLADGWIVD